MAPDAIVLVNLNKGAMVQEQALVMFSGNRPARTLFSSQKSFFSDAPLDRTELQQVEKELNSFFVTAMDVGQGTKRFYPYLPDDIRSMLKHPDRKFRMYMPPGAVDPSWSETLPQERASASKLYGVNGWKERLSDDDLRLFVALQLDAIIQQSFLLLGGIEEKVIAQANPQRPQALASNPHEFIKSLEKSVAQNTRLLERTEFLNPEFLRIASNYMKLFIGQGYVIKEISELKPCPCFLSSPADATLYVTSLTSLALHFAWRGERLRIVCAAIP